MEFSTIIRPDSNRQTKASYVIISELISHLSCSLCIQWYKFYPFTNHLLEPSDKVQQQGNIYTNKNMIISLLSTRQIWHQIYSPRSKWFISFFSRSQWQVPNFLVHLLISTTSINSQFTFIKKIRYIISSSYLII